MGSWKRSGYPGARVAFIRRDGSKVRIVLPAYDVAAGDQDIAAISAPRHGVTCHSRDVTARPASAPSCQVRSPTVDRREPRSTFFPNGHGPGQSAS